MQQPGLHAEVASVSVLSWRAHASPARQVGIGATLALAGGTPNAAWIALFFISFYICGYADSWGPLPWLYVAEVLLTMPPFALPLWSCPFMQGPSPVPSAC